MKARDLFLRILAIVAGAEIIAMLLLGQIGMKDGVARGIVDAFLLALLSAPLLHLFVIKNVVRSRSEQAETICGTQERETEAQRKASVEMAALGKQLQSLLNNLNGVVYRGHRDWTISLVGAGIEKLTGYAREEFIEKGLLWTNILHPDDMEWLRETFRKKVRQKEKAFRVEYRILRKNGDVLWIADRRQILYHEDGSFAYVDGLLLDITERKRSENDLARLHQKNELILRSAAEGILGLDLEGNHTFVNPAAARMLGYEEKELIGRESHGIWHHTKPDGSPFPVAECQIYAAYRRGEVHRESTEVFWSKDGASFPVEYSSTPILEQGRVVGAVLSFTDITGRRKAEEALVRLGMAVEQSAETVVITDTEGGIQYVNPAFERVTGYSREEAVGRNMRILKSGEHGEAFYRTMWETISRGDVWKGRFVNRRKDGRLYNEEAVISPVRNISGKIVNFVAGKRDITQEVGLQKQVRISQRMESVGTLAGGIAHDFNNALTGIVGFTELLRERMAGDAQALDDLDEIQRCADRGATLTRQLLTFSRRQVGDPVKLDLNGLITEFMKLVGSAVGQRIEIKTSLGKNVPPILADRAHIEQVLMNLCLNARDAIAEGGRIVVETGEAHLGEEFVRKYPYMKKGRYALLTVSDTGSGMDEKTRERVFEPFFTTKGREQRTGLGLAVVYGIVKQHGGYIHLNSEQGKGTVFQVYFPAIDEQPDAIPAMRTEDTVHGGTETILLAEDDEITLLFLERTLNGFGYNVLVARNGEEAVEIFRRREEVALAVLDVVMPLEGGKEAFEEMRKENPNLKVLFMSGYGGEEIHDTLEGIAGASFIRKPFGPGFLARKVREVLDAR